MNISVILYYGAAGAITIDLILACTFYKYRKYCGHVVGIMAYILLITDLFYSLYTDEIDTKWFRQVLGSTLVVAVLFIIEYCINALRYFLNHRKEVED